MDNDEGAAATLAAWPPPLVHNAGPPGPSSTHQNEWRMPIRTSACVCVVDGVKL